MPDNSPDSPLFDHDLPRELIAQEPLANRADARMMVVDRNTGQIDHRHVRDFPDLVAPGDRLVLNDTKVIPAQLVGKRTETGGGWRGLVLRIESDGGWRIVCKTRGRLNEREAITLEDRDGRPSTKLWLLDRLDGGQWLARPDEEASATELLARVGRVPLPHYIRDGQMVEADMENYQTVFAKKPGAVAAPTAGLHFTEPLLRRIAARGVEFTAVTLHVGLGTFRPISGDSPDEHQMHAEWCELTAAGAEQIAATRSAGGRVIAVGTTTVRTLESAADHSDDDTLQAWSGETDLFIRPPHDFGAIDALMTNFHFPRTTLLLLVEAFGGSELVRRAYAEAIDQRYRFYSYGDAMLIV